MSAYFLAKRAHLCVTGRHLVILDLTTGRYLGLPAHQAARVAPYVDGWPVRATSSPSPSDAATLDTLLARGLLTRDPREGKSAGAQVVPLMDWNLTDRWLEHRPLITARAVASFAASVTTAAAMLRFWTLERIVERIRARKALLDTAPPDPDDILRHVAIYSRLRPWLYPRKNNCLLHSLSLLEYLAWHGIHADWIIGVRTEPFRAHAWLACGPRVLTESPQSVARFRPILAV